MKLRVTIGEHIFDAVFETEKAPMTVAAFEKLLPYDSQVVHVRWSGEGVWIPLGDQEFGLGYENHTSHPAPGHMIFYPGGYSETEVLLAYGGVDFSSKLGQLAGNHFLTITSNLESLPKMGNHVLWNGATPLRIEKV
ncbi:DUF3830 family protein [Paenirhodobacter populi]|uniref:DUF3830 family protein n=1 Tax=Paenirhodobacter populi TaxID=2306993 RepID=A0A443K0A6_9RHOB|nr:DUF3830 family protein [Sinirhodobacter populi]RWR05732.1 DUF3830 family protein [Sinirhodobacter populi]RWR15338.1 DUF3830 family protein [Sinirhodobacter populi]RWR21479.1 DUF3830 family protein [Sinirhodobacter populi]RWR26145.1 DUF3830 family protein [Sinirhodobacter populi]